MKKLLIVVVLLILAGCGGPWLRTDGPFTLESQQFTVDLPQGWMRSNTDKYLMITRDGSRLQRIVIQRFDTVKEGQQFKYTKKRVSSDMLPQEIAEVVIDNIQSDKDNPFETVEENNPVTVAGKPGFRLQLTSRTKDGLKYRYVCYGFLSGNWFYEIIYIAPARHYFDKDLGTYENVARSFRLTRL